MRTKSLIVFLFLSAAVFAAGCARRQTIVTPGGSVTVREKGGNARSVEIRSSNGKASIQAEKRTVTEAELGVPVYPGATAEVSGSYEGSSNGETEKMQQHMLTTPDDYDKVFAFYKANLKKVTNTVNQTMGDSKMAIFSATANDGSPATIHIMPDTKQNLTRIQIIIVQKTKQP